MKRFVTMAAVLLSICSGACADGDEPAPLELEVTRIQEHRQWGKSYRSSNLTITASLAGSVEADVMGVRRVLIHDATDDLGNVLQPMLRGEQKHRMLDVPTLGQRDNTITFPLMIQLKGSHRAATKLKQIRCRVGLLKPTEENGARVVIADVLKKPNQWLEVDALENRGIRLKYVPYEQANEEGIKQDGTRKPTHLSDTFQKTRFQLLEMKMKRHAPPVKCYTFFIEGPRQDLARIQLETPDGDALEGERMSLGGNIEAIILGGYVPDDLRLIVYLDIDAAIEYREVVLKDVELP